MNKLGWIISVVLALCIIYLLTKKSEGNTDIKIERITKDSTYIAYSIELKEDKPVVIGFLENGNLRYLGNYIDGQQQNLDFHDNGRLAVKTSIDSLGNIQDGRYYFFESNGNLSNNYNYLNNNKVGVAKSYFPDVHYLKEYMEYDSLGKMYYRKTYDKKGNTLKEEGN